MIYIKMFSGCLIFFFIAAGRNIFQGPVHPPPPGGVPVFPMAPGTPLFYKESTNVQNSTFTKKISD